MQQHASPRGNGWIGTGASGRATDPGRIRDASLLSMGGGVLDEDAPEQPGPRRNQGRRKGLLSMDLDGEAEVRGEISESEVWGKAGSPRARIQEIERIAVPEPRAGEPPTQFSKVQLPGMSEPTMLDREFLDRLQEFDRLNQESGVAATYRQGFRTTTKQQDIKSKPNNYPVAEPGKSLHEAGRAVDVNMTPFMEHKEKWNKVVGNAKKAGLSWGGDLLGEELKIVLGDDHGGQGDYPRIGIFQAAGGGPFDPILVDVRCDGHTVEFTLPESYSYAGVFRGTITSKGIRGKLTYPNGEEGDEINLPRRASYWDKPVSR